MTEPNNLSESALARESKYLDERLAPTFNIIELLGKHPTLDKDKDGMISDAEVKSALPSNEYKGDDAVALGSMHALFEEIVRLDLGDKEWRKATKDDLKKLSGIAESDGMRILASSPLFKAVDKNGDGKLGKDELRHASEQLKTGPTKKTVDAILANFEIIGGKNADGLKAEQIDQYAGKKLTSADEMLLLRTAAGSHELKERIKDSSEKLFERTEDGKKVIKGDAITQGMVGDCWLIAGISSLAERDPEALEKMITENPDGTYTVKFPFRHNDKPLEATVEKPSLTERSLYATTGKDGLYGSVMEKALGQIFSKNPGLKLVLTGEPAWIPTGSPVQDYLSGSRSEFGVELLSGKKAMSVKPSRLSEEELHRVLTCASGTVTTCTSDAKWPKQKQSDRKTVPDNPSPSRLHNPVMPARDNEPQDKKDERPVRPEFDQDRRDDWPLRPSDTRDEEDIQRERDKEPLDRFPRIPENASHEFAVLKYDPTTRKVTVRNPIGRGEFIDAQGKPLDGADNGIMEMTLAEFSRHFHRLTTSKTAMLGGLSETPWWQKFWRGY